MSILVTLAEGTCIFMYDSHAGISYNIYNLAEGWNQSVKNIQTLRT